jgi:hypothetical protein
MAGRDLVEAPRHPRSRCRLALSAYRRVFEVLKVKAHRAFMVPIQMLGRRTSRSQSSILIFSPYLSDAALTVASALPSKLLYTAYISFQRGACPSVAACASPSGESGYSRLVGPVGRIRVWRIRYKRKGGMRKYRRDFIALCLGGALWRRGRR